MVINTLDDLVDAQATVNTAAAENVVSSKLSEAEQIPAVDASYDATQTEEAVQVAGEVACDDVTEEVSADKIDIDKENTDVAEEVTEKDTVVIINNDHLDTLENEIEISEPENTCDICNFVGKTPAGLKTHKRTKQRLLGPRRFSR